MVGSWQELGIKKRDAIDASIPEKWRLKKIPSVEEQKDVTEYIRQFLDQREIEITETDAEGIVAKVASGSWSAVDVTSAFCHRAALAHQLVRCLHETFFDAALADAKALDDYYAAHKKTVGPLHGLPVSLKDQFHVKNVETTMGYIGWIDTFEGKRDDPRKMTFESELVRELRALGAILYVKTAVPHTLMSGETVNNIIGYTWNPKNRNLSSGGSSGGEGALIGLRGSPVGLGTDIGGSIRIPAAFNGLYGIRPSVGRLPYEGMANSMDGQNSVLSVVGPLGTTLGAVRLIFKSLLSQQPWLYDPMVVPIPYRQEIEDTTRQNAKQLTFGYLVSDGVVTPHPPVTRAIKMVVEALEKQGHKVIPWEHPNYQEGLSATFSAWAYDGGNDLVNAFKLSGEKPAPQIGAIYEKEPQPEWNASAIAANNVKHRQWKKVYMEHWNSTTEKTGTGRPIDALISPLAPFAAARPERYKYYAYSSIVNGLDYTSVVVPVTNADKSKDQYESGYTPLNDTDKENFEVYDADIYDGAHVSVQLIGRRMEEEKIMAVAEYVGGLLGK